MKNNENEAIDYQVIRSTRSTADIIVERNGKITVRAPKSLPDEKIEDIIESKRLWIYKALAEWRDLNATRVIREYRNGEGFLYLGRSYRLLLTSNQSESLVLKDGRFCLHRTLVDKCDSDSIRAAFRDFYSRQGKNRLWQRVQYYAPKAGVQPTSIDVRELGNRWASCSSTGRLAFHWRCLMAPQTIIDYIVVHELCHFHHRDHTNAFWGEVDKIMPTYRERKEWLKKNGAGLNV